MTILLPVSLTIAAAAALLNIWLMFRVGAVRRREKISVGDGGNDAVIRRMRAHSNFVENTAFVLVLLMLIELAAGESASLWLWIVGSLYLVGRVLHPFGMDGTGWARMAGTTITMLVQLGLAIWALVGLYVMHPEPIVTDVRETEAVAPE